MKKSFRIGLWLGVFQLLLACNINSDKTQDLKVDRMEVKDLEIATLGGGCFWCVEAVYQELEGVEKVVSGFSGGNKDNATYKEVSSGTTGHIEVAQIYFDPKVISYSQILEVFFITHDPTSWDRQGNDVGTMYRSAIFTHNPSQQKIAKEAIEDLGRSNAFEDPIVTKVYEYKNFIEAEAYHQDYYANNKNQPYCRIVIGPKVEKIRKVFKDKLKH